jgi:hypothetical protein
MIRGSRFSSWLMMHTAIFFGQGSRKLCGGAALIGVEPRLVIFKIVQY